jgi:hypothetical protein
MSEVLQNLVNQPYKHGFVTDIESDVAAKGLSEDTIRMISSKKNEPEWLLAFRLKSYQAWLKMEEPALRTAPNPYAAHFGGATGGRLLILMCHCRPVRWAEISRKTSRKKRHETHPRGIARTLSTGISRGRDPG